MKRENEILNCWRRITFNNDSKAFEQLFRMLNAKFLIFGLQYVEKEIAEEIVSDVFVNCWTDRSKLQHVRNPEVFMLVSVKNKALNYLRDNSYIELVPLDEETNKIIDISRPDKEFERKEVMMKLDKAIASLPLQCRAVFILVKEDRMKCAEVAQVLDISVRTVHTQLYRAMKKLNSTLSNEHVKFPNTVIRKIISVLPFILVTFFLSACK
ncbi:RNA polymerase sigma-70 factor [Pedobacter sp. P351]|uniref:RNA polymerase sigma-70 factor n=1 Tax=Pedobacter superstes TaxID=3133441 RepID=UPI0030AC5D75